jgi:acyl carrier protein
MYGHEAGMAEPNDSKYNQRLAKPVGLSRSLSNSGMHESPWPTNIPDSDRSMPDYNEITARICALLQPFIKGDLPLNEDSELVAELGLTSLQVMMMIEQIEDDFDITVPLNILPDIRTIRDLAVQLEKLLP